MTPRRWKHFVEDPLRDHPVFRVPDSLVDEHNALVEAYEQQKTGLSTAQESVLEISKKAAHLGVNLADSEAQRAQAEAKLDDALKLAALRSHAEQLALEAGKRTALAEAANVALREALEFYADQGTYHAVTFLFDPPTGGYETDFDQEEGSDYNRPMPGMRARAALDTTPEPPLLGVVRRLVKAARRVVDVDDHASRDAIEQDIREALAALAPYVGGGGG